MMEREGLSRATPFTDLVDRLHTFYGALPEPPHDPFALFVWEVLSVHSPARKRDAAFAALKRIRALTPDAMARAPKKALEDSVALAGPYQAQRLSALRTGVDRFRRSPDLPEAIRGPLPAARRALKTLPQMADAGVQRMLLFAAGRPVAPVDAAVSRVALRLGFGTRQADAARTERSVRDALAAALPQAVETYRRAFVYLAHHAAATCTDADPHCHVCPLRPDCPSEETSREARRTD